MCFLFIFYQTKKCLYVWAATAIEGRLVCQFQCPVHPGDRLAGTSCPRHDPSDSLWTYSHVARPASCPRPLGCRVPSVCDSASLQGRACDNVAESTSDPGTPNY